MKKLGFGLMRLPVENGDIIDMKQFSNMVDRFLERGFTYFDTAYMYHGGKSECAAREALVKRHPRDSFTLTDKMPTMFLKEKEDMPRIFNEQLERCGVSYFDYYLVHALDNENYRTAQRLDTFGFVSEKKRDGQVRKMGFSFHGDADLLEKILCEHPEVDVVQLQINYLDWEDSGVQSRLCYETALRHNKDIIVMEPVKGGTLARVSAPVEQLFQAHNKSLSVPSWAIRYAAGLQNVFMVLSGMSDLSQLEDNTSYMKEFHPLNTEEQKIVQRAASFLRSVNAVPCTGCRYCVDGCPRQIPIPEYFALYNTEKQCSDIEAHRTAYKQAAQSRGNSSDCISCGQCERMCPQHLPIPLLLKNTAEIFE